MHEFVHRLLIQAQAAWRWRWYGLILAWVLACAGWAAIIFVPDRYVSSARIHINTESMLRPLMRGIAADIDADLLTRLSLVRRTLLSRPNLEQVMRMTDLDILAHSQIDEERILDSLRTRLQINLEGRQENLFSVSFTDHDPQTARNVVQALLTLFVESNLGASREDLARTQRFLEDQIEDMTLQLRQAETALSRFRVEKRDYLPGLGNVQSELLSATQELEALELRRAEEIRVRDQVRREMAAVAESIKGGAPLNPQAAKVAELEAQLQVLLTRYTQNHPDVLALRRLIDYEKQVLSQNLNGAEDGSGDSSSPRLQLLRGQAAEHNSRIRSMNERAAYLQSKIDALRAAVREIPEAETEYARLQREYELAKVNHDALLKRREAARFAEEMDTKTEPVQFRVVEPPNLPATPTAPNRPLLRAGVLFGALGAGIGFAVFLSFALPTISTSQDLEQATRLPVIGSVTRVPRPIETWRLRFSNFVYVTALGGLFVVFLFVLIGLPRQVLTL